MVVYLESTGPISVLSNVFFFCSALVGDVLLIRFFLVLGFGCLIVWAATGCSSWSQGWLNLGTVAPWTVIMAIGPFTLHLHALCRLLYAERSITMKTEDDEALWRFFYRRCGMHRLEFSKTLEAGDWVRYKAGEQIMDSEVDDDKTPLFLVVEGRARCSRSIKGLRTSVFRMYSGELFDLKAANIFGIRIGFFNNRFSATAETDVVCFRWRSEGLFRLSNAPQPALVSYWEKFILYSVANEVNRKFYTSQKQHFGARDSLGVEESPAYYEGDRSRDFTEFRTDEGPPKFSFWAWLRKSISVYEPIGIRHTGRPLTGMLARNNILAFAQRTVDRSNLSELESMRLSLTSLNMGSLVDPPPRDDNDKVIIVVPTKDQSMPSKGSNAVPESLRPGVETGQSKDNMRIGHVPVSHSSSWVIDEDSNEEPKGNPYVAILETDG